MTLPKTGPLTTAELLEVWKGAVDKSYRDPLIAAGDGQGLEVHTQALAQLARVSQAIDTTTQSMFISPWSGQTSAPAGGGQKATVTLTFARTALQDRPLVLGAGWVFVEEETSDYAPDAGILVQTGRRYTLTQDLVFNPGDSGPFDVPAIAEQIGDGYNNPRPGAIRLISQPGTNFYHALSTVLITAGVITGTNLTTTAHATVTTPNQADTFVPDHVGQYVQFTAGANVGKIGRIIQFMGPDLTVNPAIGAKVIVEWVYSVEGVVVGTFTVGEILTRGAVTLFGKVLSSRAIGGGKSHVTFVFLASTAPLAAGDVLTGVTSGATVTTSLVLTAQDYVAEAPSGGTGGASWRILDWALSWGLTATNAVSPVGGHHAWLDELGQERNLSRSPGETDDHYRDRVKTIADVVTPNAIRRALSRALGTTPWCLREVGTAGLPGIFYDGDMSSPAVAPHGALNDAYDTNSMMLFGGPAVGTFYDQATPSTHPFFQERVEVEDITTGDNYAIGYFGRIDGGNVLTLILTNGAMPAVVANVQVRGLVSGATFPVVSEVANPQRLARRFRGYLGYAEFRGYFQVALPHLGVGEFGFAYGGLAGGSIGGVNNAYDTTLLHNFYDGYPAGNGAIYASVYQAIANVKAGGVGFDLVLDDGPCP